MGEIVKFDFLVDSSQFNNSLATMQQNFNGCRQSMLQGFNSIVFDSFLNNLNSLKNAIAGTFGAFLSEAEKIEGVAARLGVMLGGDAAGGEKLAHSLERLATNGVVPLQELEQAAAALSSRFASTADISQWVSVCADISAGSKISATRLAEMTARLDDMGKAELTELANAGIYDAVNARHISWAELKGAGVVTMYRSNQFGFGLKAFMIGDSRSLFIEE